LNIALADYNEKARRDREKSVAAPFQAGGELGGGTLAAKVAGKIAYERAVGEGLDVGEAVAPASANAGLVDNTGYVETAGYANDDGPEWPDAATESAFLGGRIQSAANAQSGVPGARDEEDDSEGGDQTSAGAGAKDLPALETLAARVPAETRAILEDLFRARFVKVRKFPRKLVE